MMIFTEIPRVASKIDETQIHTNRSLMEVDSFLLLLTATMTRILRLVPVIPIRMSRDMNTKE